MTGGPVAGTGRGRPAGDPARPGTGTPRAVVALLVLLPALLLGLVVAPALSAAAGPWSVVVRWPLPGVVAGVGVLASATAALVLVARRRRRAALERARHEGERRGRESERAAHRRFLGRLDHEMKNPVTAVRAALAGVVPDPAVLDPDQARALETLRQQTLRLTRLVGDLRKLAELETQELEREPVDLAQVVRDAAADLGDQAAASTVTRRIDVVLPRAPWSLPPVRGDVDLLYLAVYNLLANAVKFSPPDSVVEVRGTEDEDGMVTVEVADAGSGIPAHELPLVFDELARGAGARGTPGSGLGLAMVRVVAERHGGTVTLRSRPGEGTAARLRVPGERPVG